MSPESIGRVSLHPTTIFRPPSTHLKTFVVIGHPLQSSDLAARHKRLVNLTIAPRHLPQRVRSESRVCPRPYLDSPELLNRMEIDAVYSCHHELLVIPSAQQLPRGELLVTSQHITVVIFWLSSLQDRSPRSSSIAKYGFNPTHDNYLLLFIPFSYQMGSEDSASLTQVFV